MKTNKQPGAEKEIEILREHMLEPEELSVLKHIQSFNRAASKRWDEDVFSDFSYVLERD
jgi:hypothetical protein